MQVFPPSVEPAPNSAGGNFRWAAWLPWLVAAGVLLWFYLGAERYGADRSHSAFQWLMSAWNSENDFEHGPLFPFVVGGLLIYRFREMRAAVSPGSNWGMLAVAAGILFYVAAFRTIQPRVAVGALPFLLWGAVLYLWGWRVARIAALPLFFFWLAIPVPSFQQYTVNLQLLSAKLANQGAGLFGVETLLNGTQISSAHGGWEPLEIAKGCSGIRSLMALLMISGAWACAVNMPMWKRAVLFISAIPLAIIGNVLRVISIFVIAEYGNSAWARGTWHDWSGLLLFYPISLVLLLCVHSLLEGGVPWKKWHGKKPLRRTVVSHNVSSGS